MASAFAAILNTTIVIVGPLPIACVSVAPLSIKNQQLDLSPGGQFSNICYFSVIFWKMSLAAKTLGPGKPCTLWARVSSCRGS